jgi:hypothetical protein
LIPITDVVWSPDGRRVLFGLQAARSMTWIIESVLPPAGPPARVPR